MDLFFQSIHPLSQIIITDSLITWLSIGYNWSMLHWPCWWSWSCALPRMGKWGQSCWEKPKSFLEFKFIKTRPEHHIKVTNLALIALSILPGGSHIKFRLGHHNHLNDSCFNLLSLIMSQTSYFLSCRLPKFIITGS